MTPEKLRSEADDLKARGDRIVASLLDEAADEIERLQRANGDLLSYLNGISRQTAAMVEANS